LNSKNPVVLTIAGSDSGGGAGIQADLKTFSAHSVFGTTAITCITAQNPNSVSGILKISTDMIEKQILAIFDYFPITAAKTGMLFSNDIIELVVKILKEKKIKLVVDPVMVATSGAKLLEDDAILSIQEKLIPLASLITPNLDEAEILLGEKIVNLEDSAKKLYKIYKVPVLLKGGHLQDSNFATDILFDGEFLFPFNSKFLTGIDTHGTGCTYSAAITANLGKGFGLMESVSLAKYYIYETLMQSILINDKNFLNHFPSVLK
jgi:hydroxymethylpyrimidine/phosphomethylpyrimidine kinase